MIPAHPRYGVLFPERLDLPVYQHKNEFMQLLDSNKCVILIGETGSGKTTQIPQWCLEYLHTKKALDATYPLKVVCTQPRRVAAMNVAKRVADEMGVRVRAIHRLLHFFNNEYNSCFSSAGRSDTQFALKNAHPRKLS